MNQYLKEALNQGHKLSDLLDRTSALCEARRTSKDRVLHWLQDSVVFQQAQNTVQNLVFNVPQGFDFEAARFSCYLEVADVLSVVPSFDEPFRPAIWANCAIELYTNYPTADAVIEFVYSTAEGVTRRYQNSAFWVAQTFSNYTNINSTFQYDEHSRSESPAGMVFDPFYRLAKGSTMTCRITPTFSLESTDPQYQYRIRGVLEGYKRL